VKRKYKIIKIANLDLKMWILPHEAKNKLLPLELDSSTHTKLLFGWLGFKLILNFGRVQMRKILLTAWF